MTTALPVESSQDSNDPNRGPDRGPNQDPNGGADLELCCPLCEYNLRGLSEPRCPECGFAFTWAELIRGRREAHRYLFEHHPKRNIWSFWKTYWRDCFPQSFWRTLNPSQAVKAKRLLLFAFVAASPLWLLMIYPFAYHLWVEVSQPIPVAPVLLPRSATWYQKSLYAHAVPPPPPTFADHLSAAWDASTDRLENETFFAGPVTVLLWPWLTLGFLMVFSQSMRRAKVRRVHVLRVVIYSADLSAIMFGLILLSKLVDYSPSTSLLLATLCSVLVLPRLYSAYRLYLRFHMPFATVLTSQICVLLIAMIVYFQSYRF